MQTLFNDGILTIYSYLMITEWTRTAATSKRNFTLAHSQQRQQQQQQQQRKERIKHHTVEPTVTPPPPPLPPKKSFFLSCCTSATVEDESNDAADAAAISVWSLRHQISAAEFVSLPFHIAPQYLMQYPKLQSLTVTIRISSDPNPDAPITKYSNLHLPSRSLLQLDLSVAFDWDVGRSTYYAGFILRSIGQCQSLTHLTLRRLGIWRYDQNIRNFSLEWKKNLTQQLTHLNLDGLTIHQSIEIVFDEFLSAISSMTKLTSLRLRLLAGPVRITHIRALKNLPQLKKFICFGMNYEYQLLTILQSIMPVLEEIESGESVRFDLSHPNLTTWAKFIHLKTLRMNGRPIIEGYSFEEKEVPKLPESALMSTLVTLIHLECIEFWNWYPSEVASWSLMESHLPSLTDLDFGYLHVGQMGFDPTFLNEAVEVHSHVVVPDHHDHHLAFDGIGFQFNLDSLPPSLAVATVPTLPLRDPLTPMLVGASQLLARLQRLSFSSCRLTVETLQQLRCCTSLTHLRMADSLLFHQSSHLDIYHIFDDAMFLPRISRLSVSEAGFVLVYDPKEGQNECRFGRQKKKLYRLQRKTGNNVEEKEKQQDIVDTVPPPLLVGIELNPGPASNTAISLFQDGLAHCFSYLPPADWITLAQVHRAWFHILALHSLTSKLRLDVSAAAVTVDTPTKEKTSVLKKFSRWISGRSKETLIMPSPWSLRHRIDEIVFESCMWNTLMQQLARYPNMTRLVIKAIRYNLPASKSNKKMKQLRTDFNLPENFTSLAISFGYGLDRDAKYNVLDVVTRAHHLLSLSIRDLPQVQHTRNHIFFNSPFDYDFLQMKSMIHLTSLEFQTDSGDESHILSLLTAIGSLPSLRRLSAQQDLPWCDFGIEYIRRIVSLPELRILHLPFDLSQHEQLEEMYQRMPRLEEIKGSIDSRCAPNLSDCARFKHLSSMFLHARVPINPGQTLAQAFAAIPTLTRLHFPANPPFTTEEWRSLDDPSVLPNLTSLEFSKCGRECNPLEILTENCPMMCRRLTQISITDCSVSNKRLVSQLSNFIRLTDLTILLFLQPQYSGPLEPFEDPKFMPLLRNVKIDGKDIRYTAPAPRLVGIELNPGPSSPSSSPSFLPSSPASHLFFDALSSIFVFLTTREFVSTASVSHYWFKCAKTTSPGRLSLKEVLPNDRVDPRVLQQQPYQQRQKPSTTPTSSVPTPSFSSPWSLHLLVTHLSSERSVHWNSLPDFLNNYKYLRTLSFITSFQPARTIPPGSLEPAIDDIGLPHATLTSLSLHRRDAHSLSPSYSQSLLNNIGRCSKLTHLSLERAPPSNHSEQLGRFRFHPTIDMTPLAQLTQLQSLRLSVVFQNKLAATRGRLCRTIGEIKSLEYLTLDFDYLFTRDVAPELVEMSGEDMRCITLHHLKHYEAVETTMSAAAWATALSSSRLPSIGFSIERESNRARMHIQLGLYTVDLFSHRDDTFLDAWPNQAMMGRQIYASNAARDEAAVINELLRISPSLQSLTCLRLTCWDMLYQQWTQIGISFPALTRIEIEGERANQAFNAVSSPIVEETGFLTRVRTLHLHFLLDFFDLDSAFTTQLARFTSLAHLKIRYHARNSIMAQRTITKSYFEHLIKKTPTLETIDFLAEDTMETDEIRFVYEREKDGTKIRFEGTAQVTPAPRLVGIELNPGPPTSSSFALPRVTSSASSLFADGLMIIFTYLPPEELLTAAAVHRAWFHVIATNPHDLLRLVLHVKPAASPSTIPLAPAAESVLSSKAPPQSRWKRVRSWFKFASTRRAEAARWSLRSQTHEIHLDTVEWSTLRRRMRRFLAVTTLTISSMTFPPNILSSYMAKERGLDAPLASSITSLSLAFGTSITPINAQTILDAISRSTQLRSLTIRDSHKKSWYSMESRGQYDFYSWRNLAYLTSIDFDTGIADVSNSMHSLSSVLGQLAWQYRLQRVLIGQQCPRCFPRFTLYNTFGSDPKLQLRVLHTPSNMDYGMLIQLNQTMPLLEELRFHQFDASALKHFKHLHTLYIANMVSRYGTKVAQELAALTNLTRLHFTARHWSLTQTEWSLLDDALVNLTQLEFDSCDEEKASIDTLARDTPQIAGRLRQFTCTGSVVSYRTPKDPSLKQSLSTFVSLTYLELSSDISANARPGPFDFLNDRTFLPLLTNVKIEGMTYRFKSTPPASRLVGIELNPGPANSSSLSSSAMNIFDDGLLIIYSYLELQDWISSASTSKHWFDVASCSKREVALEQGDLTSAPTPPVIDRHSMISAWFSNLFTSKEQPIASPPPPPSWSLVHHVKSMKIERIRRHQLSYYGILFPSLTSITIVWMTEYEDTFMTSPMLPPSLTSFRVARPDVWSEYTSAKYFYRLLAALGECIQLTSLELAIPQSALHHFGLLRGLIRLEHLKISMFVFSGASSALDSIYNVVTTFTHLTYLNLEELRFVGTDSHTRLRQLAPLTQLRQLFTNLNLDPAVLSELSRTHPQIEEFTGEIRQYQRYVPALTAWAKLTHLRRLVVAGILMETLSASLLSSMSNLTEIDFKDNAPRDTSFWMELLPGSRLTSLHFSGMNHSVISLLVHSEALTKQLQKLHIEYHKNTRLEVDKFFPVLSDFMSLTNLNLKANGSDLFASASYPLILFYLNDPTYLPLLQRCEIRLWRSSFRLLYDRIGGVNEVTFQNQKEDQKQLYRDQKARSTVEEDQMVNVNSKYQLDGLPDSMVPLLSQNETPAPRLVGIELNPGPASLAATLFNDGLSLIFSFLAREELILLALVHRNWFHVMSQHPFTHCLILHVPESKNPPSALKPTNPFNRMTAWLKGTMKSSGPTKSVWSLRARIHEIVLDNAEWSTLSQRLQRFSSATHLNIHQISYPSDDVKAAKLVLNASKFLLSPSITSLNLAFGDTIAWELRRFVLDCIHSGSVPQLRSLSIADSRTIGSDLGLECEGQYVFNALSTLTTLTSLEYDSNVCGLAFTRLLTAIGSLPQLRILIIHRGKYHIYPDDIHQLKSLTQLRILRVPLTHFPGAEMHPRMPLLEEFEPATNSLINLMELTRFKHLQTLFIDANPQDDLNHNLGTALASLPTLTRLIFMFGWWSLTHEEWQQMDHALIRLTQLEFHFAPEYKPIDVLSAHAPRIASQLTRLIITHCSAKNEQPLTQQLASFTRLIYLKLIADSPPSTKYTCSFDELDDPKVLPLLMNVSVDEKIYRSQPEPPAPRLVGIELNPGPAATPSASPLFNDGLLLIYSYMPTVDWLISCRTCRRWFELGSKSSDRAFSAGKIASTKNPSKVSHFFRKVFKSKKESATTIVSPSRWSLVCCITHLTVESIEWSQLSGFCARYPSLVSLSIDRLAFPGDKGDSVLCILSPSIHTICISNIFTRFVTRERQFEHSVPSSLLASLVGARLPQLRSLEIHTPEYLMDWHPLLPEMQLTHLHLEPHLHTDSDLLPFASALSQTSTTTLTSLTLNLHSTMCAVRNFPLCAYPNLTRLCIKCEFVSLDSISTLPKLMPRLEVIEGDERTQWVLKDAEAIEQAQKQNLANQVGKNIDNSISKVMFPYVHTFTCGLSSPIPSNYIDALCSEYLFSSTSLTRLSIRSDLDGTKNDDWTRVFLHYPRLTDLHLTLAPERVALPRLLTAMSNSDRVVEQLRHLTIDLEFESNHDKSLERLEKPIVKLTALESLRFRGVTSFNDIAPLLNRFTLKQRDDPSILPNLNLMTFQREGTIIRRYIDSKTTLKSLPTIEPTPAPRLVGIELNPGPPSSSSTASSATAAAVNLFNDGLVVIFSHLPREELLVVASVHRSWFNIVSQHHDRTLPLLLHGPPLPSQQKKLGLFSWFSQKFKSKTTAGAVAASLWSLRTLIREVSLDHVAWKMLPQQLARFPAVHTLIISSISFPAIVRSSAEAERNGVAFILPTSITSIDLAFGEDLGRHNRHRVLDCMFRSTHLRSIRIRDTCDKRDAEGLPGEQYNNFRLLIGMVNLTSFEFQSNSAGSELDSMYASIGELPLLQRLIIGRSHSFLRPTDLLGIRLLPQLRILHVPFSEIRIAGLQLDLRMPLLEEFKTLSTSSCDFNDFIDCTHLRTLFVREREPRPTISFGPALSTLTTLTHIHFSHPHSYPKHEDWTLLDQTLINLTQLGFRKCGKQSAPLELAICAPNIASRLTHLNITGCFISNSLLEKQLLSFTNLTHLVILSFPQPVLEGPFKFFDDYKYKPALTNVKIDRKSHRYKATPPSPLLVGIELNPGPESNPNSHLLAASAVNLFTYGTCIISSYLDPSSWMCAACSYRHWCTIADSSKQKLTLRWKKLPGVSMEKKTSLRQPYRSCIHIRFQPEKRMMVKFTQQTDDEKVLHRRKKLNASNGVASSSFSPPSPRLVGIELNPGPQQHITSTLSSASSSSSSTPSTLFRDGLSSIFAFLDTRSLIHAATVSQYYFATAARTKLQLSLILKGAFTSRLADLLASSSSSSTRTTTTAMPIEGISSTISRIPEKSYGEKSYSQSFYKEDDKLEPKSLVHEVQHPAAVAADSPWCLPHCLARVDIRAPTWYTLPYYLAPFIRMTKLSMTSIRDRAPDDSQRFKTLTESTTHLGLPYATLTSLTITLALKSLKCEKFTSALFSSLGQCTQLTSLKVTNIPLQCDVPIDYTPLHALTRIRMLKLSVHLSSSFDAILKFCHALGQMKSLNDLSVDLIDASDLTLEQLEQLQLPQLLRFTSLNIRLNHATLKAMSRVMPLLQTIDHSRQLPVNLSGLALHLHLTTIHLYNRSRLGQDDRPGEDSATIDVVCSSSWSTSLTHLRLRSCIFLSLKEWSRMVSSLPSLTSLELERSVGNLVPLTEVRAGGVLSLAESWSRLRRLKLVYSDTHNLLDLIRKFTHLTHLDVLQDFRTLDPRTTLAAFNSSEYLPRLRTLHWHSSCDIHFDLEANINTVKFNDQSNPQTDEEKRLHRVALSIV